MIKTPDDQTLQRIAAAHHFELDREELRVFKASIASSLEGFDRLQSMEDPAVPPKYDRAGGARPGREENPHGAWAWKSSVHGAPEGPLRGKTIVVKDNVAVAGMPMHNGSSLLEGFVPSSDATIVARILDAGGEIAGKAVCENLCFSGGSHTSHPEPVRNPRDPSRMAGGSSSGSAALVASGACDMAIGGDQGGSIRIPSAWCGIFGLKPTWGLVPYTGAFPIEPSLDHVGPMAATVRDVAVLLDVIAGRDGLDPRQINTPFELPRHADRIDAGADGLRIGILQEGFGSERADERSEAVVREAAARFERLGCQVVPVTIPLHRSGLDIWSGIATEGAWSTMVRDNSMGHGFEAAFDTRLIETYGKARRTHAQQYSPTVKAVILLGQYLDEAFGGTFYAKAQNLRRALRAAYDDALARVDLLLMPTTPQLPPPLPREPGLDEYLGVALDMMANTAAFDATGHPAMSLPCGQVEGLPVGLMLVGRRFDEATILSAAYGFEQAGHTTLEWTRRPGQ
jgi:amidase